MKKVKILGLFCVIAFSLVVCSFAVFRENNTDSSPLTSASLNVNQKILASADMSIETEDRDIPLTKDEVLGARELALYGMSTEQVERLNLVIKEANLWWEHMYLFEDVFSKLKNPDSLFWNYFDQTGEIQVSWAIDGKLDKVSICEQENLTENEFYAKYGVKVVANNQYNVDDFVSVLDELIAYTQNNELKASLQYIKDEMQLAKDNHSMEHANNGYKVLHDLDYYLLRYGPHDVGPYVEDNSTVLKYYGTLLFYE